jgi:ribosome-interacting GTPase 1
MPTNLPPEYFEIERRLRESSTTEGKIVCVEELLSVIPKHKETDKLRADLRRKLSKLKSAVQTKKKTGIKHSSFYIEKEGAGQVMVVGSANVGKSALVAALTHAAPEVASYPFSTWFPTPGMMTMENIQIQLVDTPPLNREYIEPELIELIRRSHIILIMIDIQGAPIVELDETIAFLEEHRVTTTEKKNQEEGDLHTTFLPILVAVNKCDDESINGDFKALEELLKKRLPLIPVSTKTGRNLEKLKRVLFDNLDIIRIYTKRPGQKPDIDSPFILKKGSTVEEFAAKVHHDFAAYLKGARVWGSADFDGQMVARDYILEDGDVVELKI